MTIEARPGEESLTARATDAHGQPVPVWVVDASERQDELDGPNRVYGSFCGQTPEPIQFDPGAKLEFWVLGDWWPTWWIVPEMPECFPGVATTGTVSVTLSGWTTSEESASPSPGSSQSPAPQSSPSGHPASVERSVDLGLQGHLRIKGGIISDDVSCESGVPITIQRKRSDRWVEVGSTTTDAVGAFALRLRDRSGRYRAIAPATSSPERTCLVATSAVVRHRH